jgi:Ca2+-binding RTX toxin-like protein
MAATNCLARCLRIATIAAMTLVKTASAIAAVLFSLPLVQEASAQTPPTCSFDADTGTLSLSVDGQPAVLAATATAGIRLGGVGCGAATVTNTDTIVVTGSTLDDVVTLAGEFAPGATAETGSSEIEISVSLGEGSDILRVALDEGDDVAIFTATGIDHFGDGDEDLALDATAVSVLGGPGNDVIDSSMYPFVAGLHGDGDDDVVIGGVSRDVLDGGPGNDILEGGPELDRLIGGPGDDVEDGGDGNDRFMQEREPDGADLLIGGPGQDLVIYELRSVGLTVTLDDGLANDGASGEGDNISVDVEHVRGGRGNDVLIGSDVPNTLKGGPGDDFLQGKAGRDALKCSEGVDEALGGPDMDNDSFVNCETETE